MYGNPTGGQVASGSASISTVPGTVTINQASNQAIINWQTFSIGSGELTKFVQPGSNSAALNRVLGGQTSIINGTLSANGQVYLINGNGILVGPGGMVNTAGFIASTRDIQDADFLSGNLHFVGSNGNGVKNLGTINAIGGDVILIGRTVDNEGSISASGHVGLAAADDVLVTQSGMEHLFVRSIANPSSASGQTGVNNSGTIAAATAELKAANGNIYALAINNSGLIRATGVTQQDGHIWLVAQGNQGAVRNTGTLVARAKGGKGGKIETSGGTVQISGTIDAGAGGSWLIDPSDVTIDNNPSGFTDFNVTTLNTTLSGGTNVEIQAGGVNDTGIIDVNAAVNWTGSSSLTLLAAGNININSSISGSSGGLILNSGGVITPSSTAAINVNNFTLQSGSWVQAPAGLLPGFTVGNDFEIQGTSSFLRSQGGNGTASKPYQITDVYGLEGIGSSATYLSDYYDIIGNINASGTSTWNSGAGFVPIGTAANPFLGFLEGEDYTVSNLYINLTSNNVGLFGSVGSNGAIDSVFITSANITGGTSVGALVGLNLGQITNSFAGVATIGNNTATLTTSGGSVNGTANVGGLIGKNNSSLPVNNDYAYVSVTGTSEVGGLIGYNTGTVTASEGLGSVSGVTDVGGLLGFNSSTAISGDFALGGVTATGNNVGGLVGNNTGTIVQSNGVGSLAISGLDDVGGLVGNNSGLIDASFSSAPVSGRHYVGGGIGYNTGVVESDYTVSAATVSGSQDVGGLVGFSSSAGSITQSFAIGNVSYVLQTGMGYTGDGNYFGGLVGENDGGITSSYATGNVNLAVSGTLPQYVGGLIGYNNGGSAVLGVELYATGSVTGYQYVGGLIGNNNNGSVGDASYSLGGVVTGNTDVGGLIGYNNTAQALDESFSEDAVYGVTSVGGLIGYNRAGEVAGSTADGSVANNSANTTVADTNFGGLIGSNTALVTDLVFINGMTTTTTTTSASGNVTGNAGSKEIGGLVGYNTGTINNGSSASGDVTGSIDVGGLVGNNFGGTVGDAYTYTSPTVNTLELLTSYLHAKGDVTGLDGTGGATAANLGGLVGLNSGTVQQAFASNKVNGTTKAVAVGGLIGNNNGGTVSYTYSTGKIYGNGTMLLSGTATDSEIGGLVGANSGTITWSNSNTTVLGDSDVGGFVGQNGSGGLISQSYSYSTTSTDVMGGNYVGGFAGSNLATSSGQGLQQDYSTSNVSASGNYAGGLIGDNQGYASENYSIGSVSGVDYVGGSTGSNEGTLDQIYATGAVTGTGSHVGGLLGNNANTGTVQYSYWDGVSTGLGATGVGLNAGTASTSVTELDETSGSGTYSYDKASYVGFGSDSSTSSLQQVATGDSNAYQYNNGSGNPVWYIMDAVTRPFLWWEAPINGQKINGSYQISTPQELQLMAIDLSQSYALAKSIDLTEVNGTTDKSSLWSAAGFSPVGYDSSKPFTGSFDGAGYTLSNLYINNPAFDQVGLFGDNNGSVGNVNLTGVNVTGTNDVGSLIGWNFSADAVNNVTVTGTLTGAGANVGGIIGENGDGTALSTLQHADANVTVTGNSAVGGLVGYNQQNATVQDAYSLGSVNGTGVTPTALGGLVGENDGVISTTYSISNVTGVNQVGGLVGFNSGTGSITTSYSSQTNGSATYGNVSGTTSVGGLIGENAGGSDLTYSTDSVTGTTNVGGLAGLNDSTGTLNNSYAAGPVTGTGATVGGLIGVDNAMTTDYANLYWDHVLAGQTYAVGSNESAAITDLHGTTFSNTTVGGSLYNGFDGSTFAVNANNDLVYSTTNWRSTLGSEFPVLTALSTQVSGTDYADANPLTDPTTTPLSGSTVTFNSGSNPLSNSTTNPLLSNSQTTDSTGAYTFLYPADFVLVNDINAGLVGTTLRLNDANNNSDSIAKTIYSGSGVPNLLADLSQADLWNDTVRVISTGLNNTLLADAGSQYITVPDTNKFKGTDLMIAMPGANASTVSENFENGVGDTYTINGNIAVNGNLEFDATATVGDGYTNPVTISTNGTTGNPYPSFGIGNPGNGTSTPNTNVQIISNNLNRSLVLESDGTFQNYNTSTLSDPNSPDAGIYTPKGSYAVYSQNPQGATSSTGTFNDGSNTADDIDNGLTYYHVYDTNASDLPVGLLIPGENYLLFSYQPTLTLTAVVVQATPNGTTGAVTPYNADSGAANPNTSLPVDATTGNGLITYGDAISTPTPTSGTGYYLTYSYSGVVNGDVVTGTPGSTANLIISTQPTAVTSYAQYDSVTNAPVAGGVSPYVVTFNGSALPVSLIGYKLVFKSSNLEVQSVQDATHVTPQITITVNGEQTFAAGNASLSVTGIQLNGSAVTGTPTSNPLLQTSALDNTDNYDITLTNTTNNSNSSTTGTKTFTGTNGSFTGVKYADVATYTTTGSNTVAITGYDNTSTPNTIDQIIADYGVSLGNGSLVINTGTYTVHTATYAAGTTNGSSRYGSSPVDPLANGEIYDDNGTAYSLNSLGYSDNFNTVTAQAGANTAATGITQYTNVGTYGLTVTAPSSPTTTTTAILSNYTGTLGTGSYTVTPATLTVTAADQSKIYDGQIYSGGYDLSSVSGFVNGEGSVSLSTSQGSGVISGTVSYGGSSQTAVNSGVYQIVPSGLTAAYGNYTINYVNGDLTINYLPITVAVNANYNGSNSNAANLSTNISSITAGSLYGAAPSTNPGLILQSGTLYDSNGNAISGTSNIDTALANLNLSNNLGSTILNTTNANSAGYTLNVTLNGTSQLNNVSFTAGNYTVTPVSGNWLVSPAPVTLVANNASKYYGTTLPFAGTEFAVDPTTPLQNGESISAVTLSSTAAASATASAGLYSGNIIITPGSAVAGPTTGGSGTTFNNSNYVFTYDPGNLTVNPAQITVTAPSGMSNYGSGPSAQAPTLTVQEGSLLSNTLSTFQLDDNLTTQVTNSTDVNAPGSPYTVNVVSTASSPGTPVSSYTTSDGNYQVTVVNGSWTVNPVTLHITANNEGPVTYNGSAYNGGYSYTIQTSDLKNSDTTSVVDPSGATYTDNQSGNVVASPTNAGSYTIVPSGFAIVNNSNGVANYNIAYINGSLTINPEPIEVAVNANYSGTNSNAANLSTNTSSTNAGSVYGTAPSSNPGLILQTGTLYDSNGNAISGTSNIATALTGINLSNNLTTTIVNATNANAAGYTINVTESGTAQTNNTAFTDGNYEVTPISGNWLVSPAPLTITAKGQSKTYGQSVTYSGSGGLGTPNFTVGANQLQNGQTIASLSITLTSSDASTKSTDAGTYTGGITSSAATARNGSAFLASNYSITYNPGTLTVTPEAITVTEGSGTSTYGQSPTDPGLSLTQGTLYNPNTGATLTGSAINTELTALELGDSFTITNTTSAGTYTAISPVTFNSASQTSNTVIPSSSIPGNNYTVTVVSGNWTVNQAPLTLTATSFSKQYGTTYTFAGTEFTTGSNQLQNGQTLSDVTITNSTAAPASANVATYTNTNTITTLASGNYTGGNGFSPSNYNISYNTGTLTVTPAPITVTVNANYGSTVGTNTSSNTSTATSTYGSSPSDVGVFLSSGTVYNPTTGAALSGSAIATELATLNLGDNFTTQINNNTNASSTPYSNLNVTKSGTAQTSSFTDGNYTVTPINGAWLVSPAALTLTATSFSKQYGTTYTFAGTEFTPGSNQLQNGQTLSDVTITSSGATAPANVNTYANTITTLASGNYTGGNGFNPSNYTISYNTGTLTVTPAPITVTVNANYGSTVSGNTSSNTSTATSTYGSSPSDVGVFLSSGTVYNPTTGAALSGSAIATELATLNLGDNFTTQINNNTNASSTPYSNLNVTQSGTAQTSSFTDGNYTVTPINGAWLVAQAPLVLTATSFSKQYGTTYTFAGTEFTPGSNQLQNGQTLSDVTITNGTAAPASANVATYTNTNTITALANGNYTGGNGFSPSNYSITYNPGTLTVTPAPITVTVNANYGSTVSGNTSSNTSTATSTYGSSPSDVGVFLSSGTVYNPTTGAALSGSAIATELATLNLGDNFTTQINNNTNASSTPYSNLNVTKSGTAQTSSFTDGNYTVTPINGAWLVSPAPLTLTGTSFGKVYGNTYTFVGNEFTTGSNQLQNGETLSNVTLTSNGAPAAANVGPYDTTITTLSNGNYTASSGFKLSNYTISYNPGTLTVTYAPITVTVNANYGNTVGSNTSTNVSSANSTYGSSPSDVGIILTGGTVYNSSGVALSTSTDINTELAALHLGDNFTTQVNNNTDASATPYGISVTQSGSIPTLTSGTFIDGNYTIIPVNGAWLVKPAPLTLTANSFSKQYGTTYNFAGTEFTSGPSQLQNGQTLSNVTISSLGAPATANVNTYDNTIATLATGNYTASSGFKLSNYAIAYNNGTLTVTRAPLTITANNLSKYFGFTYTFKGTEFTTKGLANNDTVNSVALSSLGSPALAMAGSYSIPIVLGSAQGSGLSNYTISYVPGLFVVEPGLSGYYFNPGSNGASFADFTGISYTDSFLVQDEGLRRLYRLDVPGTIHRIVPTDLNGIEFGSSEVQTKFGEQELYGQNRFAPLLP